MYLMRFDRVSLQKFGAARPLPLDRELRRTSAITFEVTVKSR